MSLLQSILMGILQGVTEFLPVSSSGHLAIFKNIFHVNTDTGLLFDVLLHMGTLLAVCVAYHRDIVRLFIEGCKIIGDIFVNLATFFKRKSGHADMPYRIVIKNAYRKFVVLIIVSTIPTGIIGILMKDVVEKAGESLIIPGICLLVTGGLLLIADMTENGTKTPKNVTYSNSFVIGICQGIATLPGVSRSGATIAACLLSGFDKKFAVKYSFIMSIPAILGAALMEFRDIGQVKVLPGEIVNYCVGTVVAAIVGYICIKTVVLIVKRKKFKIFAYYCFGLGVLAIAGFFMML